MSEPLFIRRTLCHANAVIGFEPQVVVYSQRQNTDDTMTLSTVATANLGIIQDMVVAEFYLDDTSELLRDRVAVVSVMADAEQSGSVVLRITGIVITTGESFWKDKAHIKALCW
jgi:hypothetical protein